MNSIESREKFTIQILSDPNEILKYLQIGTSIPIWPEFHENILKDINFFKAKSILLKENGNPSGNALIYNHDESILYFGYFGVINDNKRYILILLDNLIKYAKEKNFKLIRGPINIPTIIFGWGFMEEKSLENLFIGKPVNPPIYQELFLKNGFYVKYIEKSWEGRFLSFNPWKIKRYDFSDYEYFNPKDKNELMELKEEFLRINADNMPPSARITPKIGELFENYANFILKYGHNFMFIFLKHKPTGKIVGCGCCLPNPFRKNNKGIYDSLVAYSWAVEKNFRRRGLAMLMYGATSLQAKKLKFRFTSAPIGDNNITNKFVEKVNLKSSRTHLILELKL